MKKTTLLSLLFASLIISSCKKEDGKEKDYTLEMKVNGVQWKATKNQTGLFRRSDGYLAVSGQTETDNFGFSKSSGVTGVGAYQIPAGSFNFIYVKDGVQKIYGWTSTPKLVNINLTNVIGPCRIRL
jgi:outer membrane biogenesis lipoprotein LolB